MVSSSISQTIALRKKPSLKYPLDGCQLDLDDRIGLSVVVRLEVEDGVGEDDAARVDHERSYLVPHRL